MVICSITSPTHYHPPLPLLSVALLLLFISFCIRTPTVVTQAPSSSTSITSSDQPRTSAGSVELREKIIENVEKVSELIERAHKNAIDEEREEGRAADAGNVAGNPSYTSTISNTDADTSNGGGTVDYNDPTNPNPNVEQYADENGSVGMTDDYNNDTGVMNASGSGTVEGAAGGVAIACSSSALSDIGASLGAVEAGVLANRIAGASNHAHLALFSLSDCLSSLSAALPASSSSSSSSSSASQVISNPLSLEESSAYILGQAISLLESIASSLDRLENLVIPSGDSGSTSYGQGSPASNVDTNMVEVESGKRKQGCKRDGTTCQFSSCGRGKHLPLCAIGFAYGVTGGARGPTYIVTRSDDHPLYPRPGSLRYAVRLGGGARGVWITFARSMIVVLKSMLWVRSSTTIDGRGHNVTITGRMLVVGGVNNVILHNFQINSMALSDTIHVFAGSTKVWVDHITSFDAKLGLVSVVQRATDVTISNCKLSNRNFNMLLGAADTDISDKNLRVTVYRNWFKDSMQRMPHCRWGYCHVMNNLYTNWGYYAIGGRVHAKIRSEGNVFIAGRRAEVTPWFPGAAATPNFDGTALIQSLNDVLLNGSTFHQFNVVRHPASTTRSFVPPPAAAGASSVSVALAPPPPYRSPAAYPPSITSPRALPELLRSCAGAVFAPSSLRLCLLLSGL